jgi:hypothetical protein
MRYELAQDRLGVSDETPEVTRIEPNPVRPTTPRMARSKGRTRPMDPTPASRQCRSDASKHLAAQELGPEARPFLGPHPLCASLFTPGLKGLLIPVALDAIALLILCDHQHRIRDGHFVLRIRNPDKVPRITQPIIPAAPKKRQ